MIRVGTAGWSIPAPLQAHFPCRGSLLERFGARMNGVEINSSFYRPHQRKTYERWAAGVPADFRFSVKLPRVITHGQRLLDFDMPLQRFANEVAGLGEKLGVVLVQLPPSLRFDSADADDLFTALQNHVRCAVACEPRHASWFGPEAQELMVRRGIARVAADPPRHAEDGVPGGSHRLAYYRWHGSPRIYWSAYGDDRLAALVQAVRAEAAQDVWCIFDNTAAGAALEDALRMGARLAETGTKVQSSPYQLASKEEPMARKYSKAAGKKVKKALHEMHEGTLHSGSKTGPKVKSRKQAIAIGLSEARAEGKKVPKKKKAAKKTVRKAKR